MKFAQQKCIFGRAKRDIACEMRSIAPGPASYDVPELRPVTPAFTLGSRSVVASRAVSPGPCSYKTDCVHLSPRWSFGSSKRWIPVDTARVPGPADYNTFCESTLPKSPSFSLKSRSKLNGALDATNCVPGPGAYGDQLTQFE